jgi:hypothetical protein
LTCLRSGSKSCAAAVNHNKTMPCDLLHSAQHCHALLGCLGS